MNLKFLVLIPWFNIKFTVMAIFVTGKPEDDPYFDSKHYVLEPAAASGRIRIKSWYS